MDSQKVATTTSVPVPTDRVSTVASRNPLSDRSCGNTFLEKCSRQYRSTPSAPVETISGSGSLPDAHDLSRHAHRDYRSADVHEPPPPQQPKMLKPANRLRSPRAS